MQALNNNIKNNDVHKVKATMIFLVYLTTALARTNSICVETLKPSSQHRLKVYTQYQLYLEHLHWLGNYCTAGRPIPTMTELSVYCLSSVAFRSQHTWDRVPNQFSWFAKSSKLHNIIKNARDLRTWSLRPLPLFFGLWQFRKKVLTEFENLSEILRNNIVLMLKEWKMSKIFMKKNCRLDHNPYL